MNDLESGFPIQPISLWVTLVLDDRLEKRKIDGNRVMVSF